MSLALREKFVVSLVCLSSAFIFLSCSSTKNAKTSSTGGSLKNRNVASDNVAPQLQSYEKMLRDLYQADQERDLAHVELEKAIHHPGVDPHRGGAFALDEQNYQKRLQTYLAKVKDYEILKGKSEDELRNMEGDLSRSYFERDEPYPGRIEDELKFVIPETYEPARKAFFVFPMDEVAHYQLKFTNAIRKSDLRFDLSCDGDFDVSIAGLFNNFKHTRQATFKLSDHMGIKEAVKFLPSPSVHSCLLKFQGKASKKDISGELILTRAQDRYPGIASFFKTGFESCLLPTMTTNNAKAFFLSSQYRDMTCPVEADAFRALPEPIEAIQAKVRALLGYELPTSFIEGNDPYAPLDFSQMPKLDAILISSLVFRADFHGTIIKRLIEEHARRGAMVRILVASAISSTKDVEALKDLIAKYPNVRVQLFKWRDVLGAGTGSFVDPIHRVMHMKVFLTLSSQNPRLNTLIMGGRNIHDGFAFTNAPDMSRFPLLVNYGNQGEAWSPWRDYEIESHNPNLIASLVHHWNIFWLRDTRSYTVANVALPLRGRVTDAEPDDTKVWVRHLVSIPYKDNQQLESFYADMFDHAERKILISSPYFRPTKKIGDALRRAAERGVEISVITRLELKGDTADFILGEVNKDGINSLMGKAQMYEYTVPNEILHSKIVLIDDDFSFIGSVNLNKRSFIHDVESGLMILNQGYNAETKDLYSVYLKNSRPIDAKLKTIFWKQVLIGAFDTYL